MIFRYYLTQRPPAPGAFPKPEDAKVLGLECFAEKRSVPMLHSQAWGYVDYDAPLTEKQISQYELRETGPVYVNRETGEMVSQQRMLYVYKTEYDGDDPSNAVGWDEYFEEVQEE